jgi:MFS family permease
MFINKQFTSLWISQTLSQIATNIVLFYVTFVIYTKTLSNSSVSLVVLIFILPSFVSSIIAGVLVARMGKKWVLFITNLIRACLVVPLLWVRPESSFLYLMLFLLAFTTQFFTPAESSLIPIIVPSLKLVSANAYFSSTINITLMLGFLISPVLLKFIGDSTIYIVIVCYIFAALSILSIKINEPFLYTNFRQPIQNLFKKFFRYFGHIFSVSYKDIRIKKRIITISLFQVVLFVLVALAPGFAHTILRVGVEDVSFLVVLPTALGFFTASLYLQRSKSIIDERLLRYSTYGFTALICLIIFIVSQIHIGTITQIIFFSLLFFFGLFNGRLIIYSYASIQKDSNPVDRAKYFGLLNAYTNLASTIPVVLSGYLSDVIGIDKVILLLGLFFMYMWRREKLKSE